MATPFVLYVRRRPYSAHKYSTPANSRTTGSPDPDAGSPSTPTAPTPGSSSPGSRWTPPTTAPDTYTDRATTATLQAARTEHDFAGWLADILARTAAELGSTHALTARRPGSWEAELVQRLLKDTVGDNDELLKDYDDEALT